MKTLLSIVVLAVALGLNLRTTEFAEFQKEYGKTYTAAEAKFRAAIYAENLMKIEAHNALGLPWTYGVNGFADLTEEEFQHKFCGCAKNPQLRGSRMQPVFGDAPDRVDWREQGAVTSVKDQGACGECWAFSTVGSVEGAFFVKSGTLYDLSTQQLSDCYTPESRGGSSILPYQAMDYVEKHGLCEAKAYMSATGECKDDQCQVIAKSTGKVMLPAGDEESLKNAIALTPVSILLDASELMFYKSGIVTKCKTQINHAAVAIGYGSESGLDYYIVKNSWGAGWGEKGYCRIQRNTGGMGMCGITYSSVYPTF